MSSSSSFVFRNHDTIGNLRAESDGNFLYSCFVDNGSLNILRSCGDPRGIVVGRTGAGKSALLLGLKDKEERAIILEPENLAMDYISGSTILTFMTSLDVKMDIFYKFLWRHVLVIEIIKRHFNISDENGKLSAMDHIFNRILRKRAHKEAFEYIGKYGSRFWESTEDRIKEVTQKLEGDLSAGANIGVGDLVKISIEGGSKLSVEQKREIVYRAQEVVNQVQMSRLSNLFDALDEDILTDSQKRYFIVIDHLDESWVDGPIRYHLIKALIETMRDFNDKVRHVKVCIALRRDLFDLVLENTRDSGFQDEKYRALCLQMAWEKEDLKEILDTRIDRLVRFQYSPAQTVTHREIMPKTIGKNKLDMMDWIVERTFMRPRDIIDFFNKCIELASGKPTISSDVVLRAEGEYSLARLRSLEDEWAIHYPNLGRFVRLLSGKRSSFRLLEIDAHALADFCVDFLLHPPSNKVDEEVLNGFYEGMVNAPDLRAYIAQMLYRVGIVGLKTSASQKVSWSHIGSRLFPPTEVSDNSTLHVHKMLWRALRIIPGS